MRRVLGREQEEESEKEKDERRDDDADKKPKNKSAADPKKSATEKNTMKVFGMELTQSRREGNLLVSKAPTEGDAAAAWPASEHHAPRGQAPRPQPQVP